MSPLEDREVLRTRGRRIAARTVLVHPDNRSAKSTVVVALGVAPACRHRRARSVSRDGKRVRSRALDLITAAIALEYGCTLVTRNHKDYEDIPNLSLYQPS